MVVMHMVCIIYMLDGMDTQVCERVFEQMYILHHNTTSPRRYTAAMFSKINKYIHGSPHDNETTCSARRNHLIP